MGSDISTQSVIIATQNQISSDFADGEVVILDMENGIYFGLNATGGHIWKLIQEPRSVAEVISVLSDEYNVSQEQCTQEVLTLLADLQAKGLITDQNRSSEEED